MADSRSILNNYNESIRVAQTGYTDWSTEQTVAAATDPTTPSVPTIAATAADQAIDLVITAPSTNTDGTSIIDIDHYVIYYSTSANIDSDSDGVPDAYSGSYTTASTKHTHATSSQLYFVAVCVDLWGNESACSSEANATPSTASGPVSLDDYTDNIAGVYVGDGIIGVKFQDPKSTWERWAGWKLYTGNDGGAGAGSLPADPITLIYTGSGPGFVHKNLNTAYLYEYKLTIIGEDGTETPGTISDNSGAGYQPNAADNSTVIAETIFAENIVATNEVRGEHFKATSSLAIKDSTFGNEGIQLQYNSGDPRFYVGDGANAFLKHDGTKLTWKAANTELDASGNLTATSVNLTGAITASSGSIGGFTIGASALTAGSGATAVGIAPATYPFYAGNATAASAPFRVSSAGSLYATGATISGTITCGAGSSYSGLGSIATLNSIGASNCDTTIISGGKIITGLLTATNIQTGTLNCSLLTVSNLSASSITAGTLSASYVSAGTLNCSLFTVSNLSATSITTGILTGLLVRTSSGVDRAELSVAAGDNHRLNIYSGGVKRAVFSYGGWAIYTAGSVEAAFANSSGIIGCSGSVQSADAYFTTYRSYSGQHLILMPAAGYQIQLGRWSPSTGRTALDEYYPVIDGDGNARYLRMYS